MAINADGPAALAAATPVATPFVYFSTEYVFDGGATGPASRGPYTEDSPTHAISVYGRSKLLGEQLVLAARPDALIIRTTVVYGADPARKNFLYYLQRELSVGNTVRIVTDQISTPTASDDLARATLLLLKQRATGIFHICGPDLLSRHDFAVRAARLLNLDERLIEPITTASLNQPAPRPLNAGLRTDKLRAAIGPGLMKNLKAGVLPHGRANHVCPSKLAPPPLLGAAQPHPLHSPVARQLPACKLRTRGLVKTISIVTPCYNEQDNVLNLYTQVRDVMAGIGKYEYEHIFIDNSSRDNTVAILKQIAAQDSNVKVIVNSRNFGHIRSPIHALFQAKGDAVLGIVADLQDPPPMIADILREWENGAYCVLGIKRTS